MAVELCLLMFFAWRMVQLRRILPSYVFWGDKKNVTVIGVIALTVMDMVIFLSTHHANVHTMRYSRILRPLLLVSFAEFRQVRRVVRSIRRTLPSVLNVLVLLFATIAMFALLAVSLFRDRDYLDPDGSPYMMDYFDSYWRFYVLVTSANFPDVMMPAYSHNEWYALVFIAFIGVTMYVFLSILLAVIYDKYRKHLKAEVVMQIVNRRRNLRFLFAVLQVDGRVKRQDWLAVVLKYRPCSLSEAQFLWSALDQDNKGSIDLETMLSTVDVLQFSLAKSSSNQNIFDRRIPTVYHSDISTWIKTGVRSKYFNMVFDVVIFVNAVLIATREDRADVVLLPLYNLEVLLKIYTFGFREFFRRSWNKFDFAVIFIGTIIAIADAAGADDISELDFVLVLRVLRLIRLLTRHKGLKLIIDTLGQLGPAIMTYSTVLLTFYYCFAILGMELFGGRIYEGNRSLEGHVFNQTSLFYSDIQLLNPKLNNTDFARDGYFANNFNDIVASYVTLFELMVVNQWHIIADGYVQLTSKAARLFFFSFHLSTVLVLLNIFVAFVLEAFLMQLELVSGQNPDALFLELESKLEARQALASGGEFAGFKVKARAQSADVIYQQLFGEEVRQTVTEIETQMIAAAQGEASNTVWYSEQDV
eukprot:TRINITY_DN9861_c0_g1_i1.p1 TRINITY_DN9861_c0_g1~~TRINITY_DN9861_c0_g1_i1.p1  ORF type:complete len:665 (+),score=202.54 TRINITY_DN9861_c0_g1_i1:66-1997(+)